MGWNYRILRRDYPENEESWFTIHEVYYREDGSIEVMSSDPMFPAGSDMDELRNDFALMAKAFDRPVLDYAELCAEFDRRRAQREAAKAEGAAP